jgi:hypothetical protein
MRIFRSSLRLKSDFCNSCYPDIDNPINLSITIMQIKSFICFLNNMLYVCKNL